jgi:hypothetical protein
VASEERIAVLNKVCWHVGVSNHQIDLMFMFTTAMDISADLLELGKTPVAVVCAGAKSILDIPKTLEILVGVMVTK